MNASPDPPRSSPAWLVLTTQPPGTFDGVGDYACNLATALASHGGATLVVGSRRSRGHAPDEDPLSAPVRVDVGSFWHLWGLRRVSRIARGGTCIVQYVPQTFLRPDVGSLLAWLLWQRVCGHRVVLTAHEWNVEWRPTLRRAAGRVAFHGMLLSLGLVATHVVTPQERYRREIARRLFWKRRDRIAVIPVGSNVPVASPGPGGRARPRLAMFGRAAGLDERLLRALGAWLAEPSRGVSLRWIGRSREEILRLWRDRCGLAPELIEIHEAVPPARAARLLAECDAFLAPLDDGVSTRSTTVVAALAQGLPVVGTEGPSTADDLRRSGAFALAPAGDPGRLVALIEDVLGDDRRRLAMSASAREIYQARFSWAGIAAAYARLAGAAG